jgi:alpha-glucoside transport system substrate-binding protein
MASGNLPDIAAPPGPGQVNEWYEAGGLKSLDFLDLDAYEASTPGGFRELGTTEDGHLAGVFLSSTLKGLVWYNTGQWDGSTPATYDEMIAAANASKSGDEAIWCIGLESGPPSGWPGTDWIENYVLRQSGPEVYDQWAAGELPWTDPAIVQAFEAFGQAVDNSYGGSDYVVNTNFGRAANPMFEDPQGCVFTQQATFITDFFQNEAGATPEQYDFFRLPDMNDQFHGGVTGGGNLIGMFNDTPAARSLMEYLVSADAQQVWAERGGFVAANLDVPLDSYPGAAERTSAEILQDAEVFRFDASDMMPPAVQDAFNRGMVEFVQNQGNLQSILANIDAARVDAAQS